MRYKLKSEVVLAFQAGQEILIEGYTNVRDSEGRYFTILPDSTAVPMGQTDWFIYINEKDYLVVNDELFKHLFLKEKDRGWCSQGV